VLGLHFVAPVPLMRLVEIVAALETAPKAVERAAAFARQIGKTAIRTKDRSRSSSNLPLVPFLRAAVRMYGDRRGFYEY
jgi:3-hydroxybutyryl-CoA dehydrogenase